MARYRFSFWLDSDKDDELLLMEEIDQVKSQRLFASTIRDGIRLIQDLRRGNFDVLLDLFPEIHRYLKDNASGSNDDDLKAIRAQLTRLEQVTLQQQTPGGMILAAQQSGPKAMAVPSIKAPVFDDDDEDLLTIKRDTSTKAASNFLAAARALQQ